MFIRNKNKLIQDNLDTKFFDLENKREIQYLIAEKTKYLGEFKKLTELYGEDVDHEKERSLLKIKIDKKSDEIKEKRFPRIDFSTSPLLHALTYQISTKVNRVVTTKTSIKYDGFVDRFSEHFTMRISRRDYHKVSAEVQDKYCKNLKKFFSHLLSEPNVSVEKYIKNKHRCEYTVTINYLRLLYILKRQQQMTKKPVSQNVSCCCVIL